MQMTPPATDALADALSGTARATSVRYKVLGFLFALAALTYLDRLAISAAMPFIAQEYGHSAATSSPRSR